MMGATIIMRPLQIVSTILLARLLVPEDFGIVALAMLVFNASNVFTGMGLDAAIVHTKRPVEKIAFEAFCGTLASGTLFFLIVVLCADSIASFLGNMMVAPVIQVLAIILLTDTLALVPRSLLEKEMAFKALGGAEVICDLIGIVVSITLAYLGFGLWSLAWGFIIRSVFYLASLSYLTPTWSWVSPRRLDPNIIRELSHFALHGFASRFLTYVHMHWDDWLVGRLFGAHLLGLYSRGYELTDRMIRSLGVRIVSSVFMPVYAQLQDEPERLATVYLKSLRSIFLILVPISLGLLMVAQPFVVVLMGENWLELVPILQVFALMLLTNPTSLNASSLFLAMGKPEKNTRAGLVLLAFMIPLVLLMIYLGNGIVGVAVAVTAAYLIGSIYNVVQVDRLLPETALPTLRVALESLAPGLLMVVGIGLFQQNSHLGGENADSIAGLISVVLVGATAYGVSAIYFHWLLIKEFSQMAMAMILQRMPEKIQQGESLL